MGRVLWLVAMLTLGACGQGEPATEESLSPVELGAGKARVCSGCHGPRGVSRVATYPSLAGKDKGYLVAQLKAYKSGERENPMMNAMATNLSEQDMAHLAAFFAAQTSPEVNDD